MIGTGKLEEGKWSEKKVEGNDDLRTVECLRGRLLAERQASRLANEDAELMGSKLIELEKNVKQETKLRNKAEKRLRFLNKKLESLKILVPLDESEESSSSNICAHSCGSSASTPGIKDTEESESKPHISTPEISENLENNTLSETISSNQCDDICSIPENSCSVDSANSSFKDPPSEISNQNSIRSCGNSKTDNQGCPCKTPAMEADENTLQCNESDKDNCAENSSAIVPVSFPNPNVKSLSSEMKTISSGSVREALDALRLAREMIQNSLGRRQIIRVGNS